MTSTELPDELDAQLKSAPEHHEDEDGDWYGDYDAWLIELERLTALKKASDAGRSGNDLLDNE